MRRRLFGDPTRRRSAPLPPDASHSPLVEHPVEKNGNVIYFCLSVGLFLSVSMSVSVS